MLLSSRSAQPPLELAQRHADVQQRLKSSGGPADLERELAEGGEEALSEAMQSTV